MTDETVTNCHALKPVPCGCGGEANIYTYEARWKITEDGYQRSVGCLKCGIATQLYDTEAEAITAWNRAMGNRDNLERVEPKTFVVPIASKAKYVEFVHDGERFAHGWRCQNCGGYVEENDKYCKTCGARLEWE